MLIKQAAVEEAILNAARFPARGFFISSLGEMLRIYAVAGCSGPAVSTREEQRKGSPLPLR